MCLPPEPGSVGTSPQRIFVVKNHVAIPSSIFGHGQAPLAATLQVHQLEDIGFEIYSQVCQRRAGNIGDTQESD